MSDSKTTTERYYLVREDILPEAMLRTIEAKELLSRGEVKSIYEAVDKVGLSRSAFYKYRDAIFPINHLDRERLATISMDLEHRAGILSGVLALIASHNANVLTINQSIPLQGLANVVVSVETSSMEEGGVAKLLFALSAKDGVRKAAVIGRG